MYMYNAYTRKPQDHQNGGWVLAYSGKYSTEYAFCTGNLAHCRTGTGVINIFMVMYCILT